MTIAVAKIPFAPPTMVLSGEACAAWPEHTPLLESRPREPPMPYLCPECRRYGP